MPAVVCSGSISSEMLPVPVIASYDATGNILPLYIGFKGESYRILSAALKYDMTLIIFDCKVDVHERVRNIELTFHPRNSIWTIPRQSIYS